MWNRRILVALCALGAPLAGQLPLYTYPGQNADSLGDVDRDGARDFVTFGATSRVWSGRDGTLLHLLPRAEPVLDPSSPLGDLDGDAADEIGLPVTNGLRVYAGRTGALLYAVDGPATGTLSARFAGIDDIDGDGRADLLVSFGDFATAELRLVSGASGAVLSVSQGQAAALRPVRLGDVDADGTRDYAVGWEQVFPLATEQVEVFSGRTHERIRVHGPLASVQIAGTGDLDGDGAADYLLMLAGRVDLISGRSGARLHAWQCGWFAASAGDYDGDGVEDLAIGTCPGVGIFSGAGFAQIGFVPAGSSARPQGLGDIDGDGLGELLVVDQGDTTVYTPIGPDFAGTPSAASLGTGPSQAMHLAAPLAHAGQLYWILGGISGTQPGFPLAGRTVPLQLDPYTFLTASLPVTRGPGLLSATGEANASLALPPLPPVLAGLTLHHVYVVLGPTGLDYVSRPAPLGLLQ